MKTDAENNGDNLFQSHTTAELDRFADKYYVGLSTGTADAIPAKLSLLASLRAQDEVLPRI